MTLFTLLRTFEFVLGVPPNEVRSKTTVLQRPVLRSDTLNKAQLPLLIRAIPEGPDDVVTSLLYIPLSLVGQKRNT